MTYALEATYYRTALLLGLVQGKVVLRWADKVIEREAEVPPGVFDLVTIPEDDLSGLRHALWPLSIAPEPLSVFRAMLALVHADLGSGRRGISDTLTVLRQMRSMLRLPPPLYAELNAVMVEQSTDDSAVPQWLAGFANEHVALLTSL